MYRMRLTERSSQQHIANETNRNAQMKKKLADAEMKIERLNQIIQVSFIYL